MMDDFGAQGTKLMAADDGAERSPNMMSSGPEGMAASMKSSRSPQAVMRARNDAMAMDRRIDRTGVVVGLSTVINEATTSFPGVLADSRNARFGKAVISWAPLLALPARRGKSGFGGFVSHPAVWGAAAIGAITILREKLGDVSITTSADANHALAAANQALADANNLLAEATQALAAAKQPA
jgi:hypothetical protein